MKVEIVVSIFTLLISIFSISLTFLTFKKNERNELKKEGKNEGLILSDIGYIKACVDRVEKNMDRLDEKYKDVLERLSKAEESIINVTKRIDSIYSLKKERNGI